MTLPRRLLHVDMDAFFASVEELDDPALRGKVVIVGGHNTRRGVVSAANYPARASGVHAAMPLARARQLCPQGIFLPVRMNRYAEVSRQFHRILEEYTPLVESMGLDEAYLDVSGTERLFGDAVTLARHIQRRIRQEVGLSCSLGVSFNKFLAKIASGWKKPQGLTVILETDAPAFLDMLPVGELPGVGSRTREQLEALGIRLAGDLQKILFPILEGQLGKLAGELLSCARGIDPRPVVPDGERKSLGEECTFEEDTGDPDVLLRTLLAMNDRLARQLRKEGMRAQQVTLKIRDPSFHTTTRGEMLPRPSDHDDELYAAAKRLFTKAPPRCVRLIGLRLARLSPAVHQDALFDDRQEDRQAMLCQALDQIQGKYGEGSIHRIALVGRGAEPGKKAKLGRDQNRLSRLEQGD